MPDKPLKYSFLFFQLPWIFWGLTVAVLLLLPSEQLPKSNMLSYDKLGHIGVFLIFAWLFSRGLHTYKAQTPTIKSSIAPLTISIVYSAGLELLQQFSPGRMTDLWDVFANVLGAVTGTILFATFSKN